jgi:geranylgeranyldiphosphate transferase
VFSSDVITAKGALAEDLANGEYTFPILVALYSTPPIREAVEGTLCHHEESGRGFRERVGQAALMLQKDDVRIRCLTELGELREQNRDFASLWGRKEQMVVDCSKVAGKQEMALDSLIRFVGKYRLS